MSNQDAGGSSEKQPEVVPKNETSNPEESSPQAESSTPSTSTQQPQPTCQTCAKSDTELTKCSKCKSVFYCSKECQKAGFKAHKKVCPLLAQEWMREHGGEVKMASRSSGGGRVREKGIGKWEYDT